ncbi:DUF2304 domain-containing protein [Dorea longicatena]|jgi:hypothetical protein|uniref:DUF2304 domain-containing protein n=1 Tax=Dorea longicatena TaxID=88431 RepID=UPI00189AC02C|nr:DUF2304 domain-containing protein [Dorea longicatena]UOX54819.1 DUF2304 domain-containing protein [Dorea longicatena]
MSGYIRVLLIIGACSLMLFMLKKIRQSKLKIEYVIFWFCFSSVLVLMGIFPKVVSKISGILGFQSPVNMVFLIIIFILIVKLFFNTLQISALENKVDSLAQQIAIDRKMDHEVTKKEE